MKYIGTFLLGAAIAGYGAWQLKPPSAGGLALSVLTNFADAQAAVDRATYEYKLGEAEKVVTVLSAQVADAEYQSSVAKNAADAARQEALGAQAQVALLAPSLIAAQEAVDAAERAVEDNPTLDTMQVLIAAQQTDITYLIQTITVTQTALSSTELAYTLLQDAYTDQGSELLLSKQATKAAMALAVLATERVEQLDGRRVRWGPSLSIGCNLIGCSARNVTALVGVSMIYGR